jgi:hypothetical protein
MRRSVILFFTVAAASNLVAQGDHGGVGRAGGRTAHEGQQSEALAQNNDPRFLAHRKLIEQHLSKSVRQVVIEYEQAQRKKIQLAPDQFLAVEVAAKENSISADILAASVGGDKGAHHGLAAATASGFQDRLANSLQLLGGLKPDSAREAAKKAVAAISATPAS